LLRCEQYKDFNLHTHHLENWTRLPDVIPIDVVTDFPTRLPSLAEGVHILLDPYRNTFALSYDSGPSTETITHWMDDLILPQLLAYNGHFVLHCGAVASSVGALGFMGPSGHGKSTITASLHRCGLTLMSDDAMLLRVDGPDILAERLHPSLRLFQESIDRMFPNTGATTPVADYTDKRHVAFAPGPASAPLIALFRLADSSDDIRISRLTTADACIALIANSFALDPGDPAETKYRFAKAAEVARNIPVYDLHYPRDYGVLPDIHDLIFRILGLESPGYSPA
jgi:hypothetical protein